MRAILYICTNDGSDMRINKEIKVLSGHLDIIFLGVGNQDRCFVKKYCKEVHLIEARRNSIKAIIYQWLIFNKLYFLKNFQSIHVINEQLMILYYPYLFFKNAILDIFDSVFLKKNKGGEKLIWLKRMVYAPINEILVTDENRLRLMPDFVKKKCKVLPNYPWSFKIAGNKENSDELRILYNGWMGCNRGTEIIEGLINSGHPVKVYMAGWFSDKYTEDIVTKYPDQIEYLGIIPQDEALRLANEKADYILCVYAPINANNINASPNKIYDAIQVETPVIINREVIVSDFIGKNNIGFILDQYIISDYSKLYESLLLRRGGYLFDKDLKEKYTWENVSNVLLKAHKIYI